MQPEVTPKKAQNQQNDWDEPAWGVDIPKTVYTLDPRPVKNLLPIIDILKNQNIFSLKAKFAFQNDKMIKLFEKAMKEQQDDEYFREKGRNSNINNQGKSANHFSQFKRLKFNDKKDIKKGYYFYIGCQMKSQIFMKIYKKKLQQLEKDCNVQIFQFDKQIYIQSQKKVAIVNSEMMEMYKKLKIYIFFNNDEIWETAMNSQLFKKELQKIGIFCQVRMCRSHHVAFYSLDFQRQQIRRQVLKKCSYQPRVLKLYDNELSHRNNLRISDLLVKSIRSTINQLKQVYECDLEVNKNRSCFVMHLKHKAFQDEPVALISNVITHLFFISFPLRHSRTFINQLKRNSKKYPFIIASRYSKTVFCCIDRTKIKQKRQLFSIFSQFLDEISQKSKLTIHLKPNCVLQQKSTIPLQILNLTEQCNVQVEDYQKIIEGQKCNIVITPRLFTSLDKKPKKQLEFGSFLVKLLMLQDKDKQVTEDQLNQSIHENLNTVIIQQSTQDSVNGVRGNRKRGKNNQETETVNKNKKIIKKQQVQKKQNTEQRRGNRGNRQKMEENKVKQQQNLNEQIDKKVEQSPLSIKGQQPPEQKPLTNFQFELNFQIPQNLESQQDPFYKKSKKNKQVEDLLDNRFQIKIKAWKLKICHKKYKIENDQDNIVSELNKKICYLVESIDASNDAELQPIQFTKLKNEQVAYLVYTNQNKSNWIPTHVIQKFQE